MIDASAAMKISSQNKASKWPIKGERNRLLPDCLPSIFPGVSFSYTDPFFTIGSCFARNIEEHLIRSGIEVLSRKFSVPDEEYPGARRPNDILVKYTPDSIEAELRLATGVDAIETALVTLPGGKTIDLQLGSNVGVTFDRAVERRREVTSLYRTIANAKVVVLTLGLVESWVDSETEAGLCGTPSSALISAFPDRFKFRVLTFDEARESVRNSVRMIKELGGGHIVITTSPVPLGRTFTKQDVIVANCDSKSKLRVIAQEMATEFECVEYFPSFEMVMLSDPNTTWETDQRHVLDSRVKTIIRKFVDTYIPDAKSSVKTHLATYHAAIELFENEKFSEAADLINSALGDLSDNHLVISDAVKLNLAAGRTETALAAAKTLASASKELQHFLSVASIQLKRGETEPAMQTLATIFSVFPQSAMAPTMLSNIFHSAGNQQSSKMWADKAVSIVRTGRREGPYVYRTLTRILNSLGEAGAEQDVRKIAVANFPSIALG